ncbi:MAG: TetR/AcrR family transcriptional regulator [Anaerolineae bacterium]|nr:TetR/AcrR family transcriptional regulator [Anaerolineae bacterium]
MMEKTDRRIRKTRQQLGEALVSLILEKGYDTITIKEITARADVAHATFYRHYRNKDELLARRLEEVVQEIEVMTREPSLQDAEGYLIFKHAQENSILYHILLSSPGTTQVRKRIQATIAANVLRTCTPLRSAQRGIIPPQAAANHIAGSMLLLIEWWLDQKMPHPPHQMAKVYEQLVTGATVNAVLNGTTQSDMGL